MSKDKNKYRKNSYRMPGWDYSKNGKYFITFVTQNRECNLGKIVNKKMILSDFGKIVETEWQKSFDMRRELFCEIYVIMPNHIHAILKLKKPDDETIGSHGRATRHSDDRATRHSDDRATRHSDDRATRHSDDDPAHQNFNEKSNPQNKFERRPKSISSFIAGFKSAVNTKIDDYIDEHDLNIPKYNRKNHFFQPNYHDHIIRNYNEYIRIENYIKKNPEKWKGDNYNDSCL